MSPTAEDLEYEMEELEDRIERLEAQVKDYEAVLERFLSDTDFVLRQYR